MTQKKYRHTVHVCRKEFRKAQVHLVRDVKYNKKGFYKYLSSKRKTRDIWPHF